ncbi:MAG: dihydrodipicolinate synthase family protein [Bryobacteraceae bacterium]
MSLPQPLRGIVTPLITPLEADFSLDAASLDRLVDHVIGGGVNGIFPLGTSGEGPVLSMATQRATIERACAAARGRVPVLAGVTHASVEESIGLARHAAACGASAVVTAGPLYMPVSQSQLIDVTRRLADASPIPVFLYNMPSHTHVFFEEATVLELAAHPNITGLKDSSGQIMYLHGLRRRLEHRPDFSLLVGPEEMMPECVMLGIHGGVNGGSNLFPELYVSLYDAAMRGDLDTVRKLQRRVQDVSTGAYGASYLLGVKCAAAALGLCRNVVAPPYRALEGEAEARVRAAVARLRG